MKQYIFILLSLFLAACSEQDISEGGTSTGTQSGLRLRLTLGNGVTTRALGDSFVSGLDEKRIDRLAFFVHTDEDGLQIYPPVPDNVTNPDDAASDYPNQVYLAETAANSRQYTADVALTAGGGYMADIVAIANLPKDYDYNQIVTWKGLQDSVLVWSTANMLPTIGGNPLEMPACTAGTGIDDPNRRAFAMYGYTRHELVKEESNAFSLAMERLVSRIDITNEAYVQGMTEADPKGGFLLSSVRLLHARPASYITPQDGYTSPDVATVSDWVVTPIPYGKATAANPTVNPTREPDAVDANIETNATLQYLWHALYTYENSDTEHAPTALEIKGKLRGTEITRRIDFINKDKQPVPIVRNTRYLIRILPAPGQTDIEFDLKVSEWDAVDTINVKPDQTAVPVITNFVTNATPNVISAVTKAYDLYYTQDGEITFDATCSFAPGVRVKYYDNKTDNWTTKGDWLTVEQVGNTEIVTKANPTYKNSYQVTFNKFDGNVSRKAMLLVHNGGSEVECDTILVRHVKTYPGTDFEPEAVAKRDDGTDIIMAPVNIGATKVVDKIKMILTTSETDDVYQDQFEKVGYYFQWGRKTGTKYMGSKTKTVEGPILIKDENNKEYQSTYILPSENPERTPWSSDSDPSLWNAGTDDVPLKGKNDPCPSGWRIITLKESNKIKNKVVIETTPERMCSASITGSNIKLAPAGAEFGKTSEGTIDYLMLNYQGEVYWFTSLSKTDAQAVTIGIQKSGPIDYGGGGKATATPIRCIQE